MAGSSSIADHFEAGEEMDPTTGEGLFRSCGSSRSTPRRRASSTGQREKYSCPAASLLACGRQFVRLDSDGDRLDASTVDRSDGEPEATLGHFVLSLRRAAESV